MALDYLDSLRRFGRDARLVFLAAAVLWFSIFGVYSVLFNLYLLRLEFGPEFVGLVNAGGLLSGSLCALPAGEIGRRWGTRRAMAGGLALAALGYGLAPLASAVPEDVRAPWLLVTYFIGCLGAFAVYMVNVTPYLMGVTDEEQQNHAFSLLSAIPAAAAFLGSLAGGLLPSAFAGLSGAGLDSAAPYGSSLILAALLLLPAVGAVWRAGNPRSDPAPPQAKGGRNSGGAPIGLMAALAVALFVRACGQGTTRVFFNVYLDDGLAVPTSLIGTLAAVSQLVAIPAALTTPLLARRWGNARTYVVAILGMAAGLLPLALIPRREAAALGYLGVTVFFALASPSITVFSQSLVPTRWRPTMEGSVMMAVNLGRASMAFGGGYIIASSGYRTLFLTGATLMVAGALLFWGYFRHPRGELARTAAPAPVAPPG
ncbi:MAG: MFS transporter [Anaerolineae bacterium]|nr:MFS transporter [Anaerolineae bacterium]